MKIASVNLLVLWEHVEISPFVHIFLIWLGGDMYNICWGISKSGFCCSFVNWKVFIHGPYLEIYLVRECEKLFIICSVFMPFRLLVVHWWNKLNARNVLMICKCYLFLIFIVDYCSRSWDNKIYWYLSDILT